MYRRPQTLCDLQLLPPYPSLLGPELKNCLKGTCTQSVSLKHPDERGIALRNAFSQDDVSGCVEGWKRRVGGAECVCICRRKLLSRGRWIRRCAWVPAVTDTVRSDSHWRTSCKYKHLSRRCQYNPTCFGAVRRHQQGKNMNTFSSATPGGRTQLWFNWCQLTFCAGCVLVARGVWGVQVEAPQNATLWLT